MPSIQIKRGTAAQIAAAALAGQLNAGEVYLLTDQGRIAVGLTASTYEVFAKQSEAGGGGGGGGLSATLTVDFGTGAATAARRKTFDVAMAGAVVGQKVQASASLDMPAGLSADEYEMDPFVAAGQVVQAGQVRLTVASLGAPLSRQRRIHVSLT